jgi:hypothetical protein
MANKDTAFKILDYIEEILDIFYKNSEYENFREDIDFHNLTNTFYRRKSHTASKNDIYFNSNPDEIKKTIIYESTENINSQSFNKLSALSQFFLFILLQLINDIICYKS